MRTVFILIMIFACISAAKSQEDYLTKGNDLLNRNKFYEAEELFREALKSDSGNLVYQAQLSFSLIQQDKFDEAQPIIENILLKDSLNTGALWYGGLNNYMNETGDKRKSILYFQKVLPYIEKNGKQYFSANWFIGRSYQVLLANEGLSYDEVSHMLDAFMIYVKLQPDADDTESIFDYVEHIKKVRPPSNVKKWVNIPEGKNK